MRPVNNNTLSSIRLELSKKRVIVISGHQNPDGDCIGACLALALCLKEMGKEPIVLLEEYGGKYDLIPGKELVWDPQKSYDSIRPEVFVALDCGDEERLGAAEAVLKRSPSAIVLDHHQNNQYFGDLNFVDVNKSSTCEIVFDLLEGFFPINRNIAAALYAGILYDTGAFRHSSTSPATMVAAGVLMGYGVPHTQIYHAFFDSRSFSEMKLMGRAFDNAKKFFGGKYLMTTITLSEMAELGGSPKELDAIVNYIKGVNGTAIVCFFYEKEEGVIKASFRCADGYDVCALARIFGGGGHVKAAGCTFLCTLEEAARRVMAEVEKLL